MESVVNIQWAFSNKRQASYATPNPDVDIDQSHPFEGADIADHTALFSDNAPQYGKGHEFATRNEVLSWDVRFRRSFQATTTMLGWGFAFHLGKVTTTNLGGGAYSHLMEYMHPIKEAGYYGNPRQQPCTTIVEQVTSGLTRQFPSCQVMAVEVTGALNDWVRMSFDMIGSGKKNNLAPNKYPFVFPESVEGALLRNASLLFQFGPTGSYSDHSCEIQTFRFRSEYSYFEAEGYCPGSGYQVSGDPHSGQIRGSLEFSRRAVILEFALKATSDNSVFEYFEKSIDMSALITITGDLISGGNSHSLVIDIPRFKFRAVPIGVDGDKIVYNVQTVIMYDATKDNPFDVTVVNTTPGYLASS